MDLVYIRQSNLVQTAISGVTTIMGAPDIFSVGGPLSEKYDNIGYETIDCSTILIVKIQNSIKNIITNVKTKFFFSKDMTFWVPQTTYMASLAVVTPLAGI